MQRLESSRVIFCSGSSRVIDSSLPNTEKIYAGNNRVWITGILLRFGWLFKIISLLRNVNNYVVGVFFVYFSVVILRCSDLHYLVCY